MTNELGIKVGLVLDTKSANSQYLDLKNKIEKNKFNIDLNINTKSLQSINAEFSNIQKQIDSYANSSVSTFNKMTKAVEIVTTETDKYKLSNGGLREVITKTNAAGQQFRTIIDKVTDGQGKLITTTQNLTREQSNGLKYWTQYGKKIKEVVTDYAKAEDETNDLRDKIAQLNKVEEQNVTSTQNMGSAMGETSNHAVTLGQRIVDAAGKVALFRLATTPITMLYDTINEAKDAILEFDEALTEFKKVSDLSDESLDAYTQKLGELGTTVGRTRTEMVSAAQEFVKSGFGEEQAAELGQVSEMFRNVVDEEISSAESAGFLVSMMKAYDNETTEFAEHIANAIDNVSNNMAVSSGDIQSGLSKVASAFATTGNTAEESIALVTSATEVMHGQANKVSRGWRTASATLSKMAESTGELSYTVDGVEHSISLLDSVTGDFIGTYKAMQEIYTNGWQEMSNLEKANLALQIGSKTQMEVVLSTLNNFEGAEEALNLAINDNNAAWEENERYMESIKAQLNLVKAQFDNLILGNGGLQQGTVALLKFANELLGVINSLGGLKTIVIGLIGLAVTTKINSLVKGASLLSVGFSDLVSKLGLLLVAAIQDEKGFRGLAQSFIETKTEAELTQMAVGGLFAILTAGVAVFSLINSSIEKHNQEIETARQNALATAQSVKTEISALDELRSKIESEDLTRAQLDSILEKNLDGYDSEKEALDKVTDARQRAIDKIDEERKKKAQAWLDENKTQALSDQENLQSFSGSDVGEKWYQNFSNWTRGVGITSDDTDVEALKKYDEEIKTLTDDYENLSWSEKNRLEHLQEQRNTLADNIEVEEKNTASMLYMNAIIQDTSKAWDDYNNFCEESVTQQDNVVESSDSIIDALNDIKSEYGYTRKEMEAYCEQAGEDLPTTAEGWLSVATAMHETSQAGEDLTVLGDSLKSLESDYHNLKTAIDDVNDGGTLTADNLQNVLTLTKQYSDAVSVENGQLVLNEQAFKDIANAKITDAEATLLQETRDRLAKVAKDDLAGATEGLGTASSNAKPKMEGADEIIVQLGNDASISADKIRNMWNALDGTNTAGMSKAAKEAVGQIENYFKSSMTAMEGYRKSVNMSYGKQASSSAKASKSAAKESKDAWLEAYKAEKDALESLYKTNVITAEEYATKLRELSDKYLTDTADHQKKYAKEIHDAYEAMYTALKKSAKEALDEEEKRLKKVYDDTKDQKSKALKDLKKLHEEEEKAIKREIDALKKEKDAIKDGYDARIKALKSEREEYERQVKLMQLKEKLAKAKTTKQYVMNELGRFTYQEDSEAVDQAREDLIEEESKQAYERELNALEQARDNAIAIYEQRIQALEDHYDAVKERNDRAEEQLEAHYDAMLEQYERNYNDFKENADKYLNGQMQLVNAENTEWGRRLTNLANFVNEYNRLMNSLNSGSTNNSNNYSGASSKGASVSSSSSKSKSSKGSSSSSYKGVKSIGTATVKGKTIVKPHYSGKGSYSSKKRASGDASIASDGVYLVGDSPNQELIIGSKLNGVPLTLSRGDGVVNAKSTRSLAGILNMISGLAKPLPPNQTTNNSTSNVTISNVSLPNVKNGEEFIDYLQHFDIDMMQRSYDNF